MSGLLLMKAVTVMSKVLLMRRDEGRSTVVRGVVMRGGGEECGND